MLENATLLCEASHCNVYRFDDKQLQYASGSAAQTSSAYSAGVAAGSANTAAATTSAYNAGVATGSVNTAAVTYRPG